MPAHTKKEQKKLKPKRKATKPKKNVKRKERRKFKKGLASL